MTKLQFRLNIILFFIISVLFFVSISAFDPFISAYAKNLGISPAVIGSIMGVTGLASVLVRFPLGVFADILNRRRLIIQLGLFVTVVGWTVAFLDPGVITLYLGKFLDGITGSTWVIYTVMFASYFSSGSSANSLAYLTMANYAGALIGSMVGGIVAKYQGYPYSFLVAVFAAAIAIVLTFFLKEPKMTHEKKKYNIKQVVIEQVTDKNLWILSLLAIVSLMAPFGMMGTFTPLEAKDLGAGAIALSWLSNTYFIAAGVAAASCGVFFYKKIGLVNTAVLGAFLQFIDAVLTPYAPNLPLLFLLQAFSGVAFALNFTVLMSLIIVDIPDYKQSTRMGLFQSVYCFGIFFGPVLMGILTASFSRSFSFVIIGILSAISGILIKLFLKTKTHEKQKILTETIQVNKYKRLRGVK